MKTIFTITFLAALVVLSLPHRAMAQNATPCAIALDLAANEFANGYFETAADRIYTCLGRQTLTEEQEMQAYLLLGRIHYASLKHEEARDSIRRALEKNPALQVVAESDKPGFVAMVEDVKQTLGINPAPPEKPLPQNMDHFRKGVWMSLGVGPAAADIDCEGCGILLNDDPWAGGGSLSRYFAIGATINPQWQLGLELSNWDRKDGALEREANITYLGAIAHYYVRENSNFFLKGGLGIGGVEVKGPSVTLNTGSGALQLGLGYDFTLGTKKQFAMTPTIQFVTFSGQGTTETFRDVELTTPGPSSFLSLTLAARLL